MGGQGLGLGVHATLCWHARGATGAEDKEQGTLQPHRPMAHGGVHPTTGGIASTAGCTLTARCRPGGMDPSLNTKAAATPGAASGHPHLHLQQLLVGRILALVRLQPHDRAVDVHPGVLRTGAGAEQRECTHGRWEGLGQCGCAHPM